MLSAVMFSLLLSAQPANVGHETSWRADRAEQLHDEAAELEDTANIYLMGGMFSSIGSLLLTAAAVPMPDLAASLSVLSVGCVMSSISVLLFWSWLDLSNKAADKRERARWLRREDRGMAY